MLLNNVDHLILEVKTSGITYISLSLSDNTAKKLNRLVDNYKIPNAINPENYHITLLKSNKSPNIAPGDYKLELSLEDIKKFVIMTWYSNKKEFPDKRLMVLEFTSYQLIKLRNHLARVLNLPQASLIPLNDKFHITLSYNVGDKKAYPITKDIINPFPLEITKFRISIGDTK